jgi:hypothetical protein
MPLCPQITITPVTVTSSNMVVTSVIAGGVPATYEQLSATDAEAQQALADAAAAQATAATAITNANAALAEAEDAYDAAVASLQPSANTIVNASNQITAINGNGITVYAGTSATTGARVVLNSTGLAGFNASNNATFSISASTGAAVFSGDVTGATITGSGINIAGKFIVNGTTGVMTATDAIVTGTITATTGSFTGTVTATTGSFTGSIFSSAGTIGGWSIGSTSISKVVGTLTTTLNASNGFISVYDTSSAFLSGGAISVGNPTSTTSISTTGIGIGSDAAIDTRNELGGYSGILRIYTPLGKGMRLVPDAGLGSTTNNVSVEGHLNSIYTLSTGTYSSSSTDSTTGTYMSQTGAIIARRSNQIPFFAHRFSTSGTSEMIRLNYNGADAGGITTTSGGVPAFRNASDYRLKTNIQDFVGATDIIKQVQLRTFEFIKELGKTQVGFIAHELAEVLPDLVLGEKDAIDEEGNPAYQSVLATNLIPYLTGAIKELAQRVEALEGE